MTRKKTTTGTMGSKRKTEAKVKVAPEKASAPKQAEHKANEVIPEVAIALLEANPTLPDRGGILDQFADYFRAAKERAEALASAPAPAPEPEKPRVAERKVRATLEPPRPRMTSAFDMPAVVAPVAELVAPEPIAVATTFSVEETAEVEAEPLAEVEQPVTSFEADPYSPFETEPARETDDLFALLAGETPAKSSDDDFDFSYQTASDQSSPFLAAPSTFADAVTGEHGRPVVDDGATRMISAVEDDGVFGTPIAQEALPVEAPAHIAPTESTMMIQAMPDDEPTEAEAGRKSKKSSKKRRG